MVPLALCVHESTFLHCWGRGEQILQNEGSGLDVRGCIGCVNLKYGNENSPVQVMRCTSMVLII